MIPFGQAKAHSRGMGRDGAQRVLGTDMCRIRKPLVAWSPNLTWSQIMSSSVAPRASSTAGGNIATTRSVVRVLPPITAGAEGLSSP
jgi:hypothetical protein